MTNPNNTEQHEADGTKAFDRRTILRGATALAATAMAASGASARDYGRNAEPQRYPDPDIVVIDDKRFKAKVGNTAIKRLYTGCLWAEGPAWNAQGQYLVWSDIPANRQLRYLDDDGHISEQFHKPSNEANGSTFDFEGRQITAERTRLVRYEHDGTVTSLAEQAGGKQLNGPNDMVVHPNDKSIWFTDPGYGAISIYEASAPTPARTSPTRRKPSTASMRPPARSPRSRTSRSNRTASPSATTTRRSMSATPASRIIRTPRTSSGSTTSTATSCPTRAR